MKAGKKGGRGLNIEHTTIGAILLGIIAFICLISVANAGAQFYKLINF